jgi:hypothetical protein
MNWELVDVQLEKLHPGFMNRLLVKHPRLTAREKKLCACLRLGLTSKEIAGLMQPVAAKRGDCPRAIAKKNKAAARKTAGELPDGNMNPAEVC